MAKTKERPTVLICTQCGYVHWFLPRHGSYEQGTAFWHRRELQDTPSSSSLRWLAHS